jgi:hypothetical protein
LHRISNNWEERKYIVTPLAKHKGESFALYCIVSNSSSTGPVWGLYFGKQETTIHSGSYQYFHIFFVSHAIFDLLFKYDNAVRSWDVKSGLLHTLMRIPAFSHVNVNYRAIFSNNEVTLVASGSKTQYDIW